MLQDLLSDRHKQVVEHEMEIQGLLQSVNSREQENQVAAEKVAQTLTERNSELQALCQYLEGRDSMMSQAPISNQRAEIPSIGPPLGEQTAQGSVLISSVDDSTLLTAKEDASIPRSALGDLNTMAGLEKELSSAKEELELMAEKERDSQLELSALQSMMAVQEEELQVREGELQVREGELQVQEEELHLLLMLERLVDEQSQLSED
ncbi:Myomegalin [Saguinus oedipus]|uniref:Myomegalin n=1 Tax=Saguinus oedipus TaxID=9490 RepID=A0ABQ9V2A3_SAGOE|nr:Myomegalin [Saguinus oedipus]